MQEITQYHEEPAVMQVITPAIAAIQKSEVEAQLDAAHKYPRRVSSFIDEAKAMIQRSQKVAEMCFFSLPRGGKQIMGPSVRLAEIAASAYGNLHVGARPLDVSPDDVDCVSQGVAWDLQKNVRFTVESRRRITDKHGRRYNEDMILMTQNAASSIALRNAVFRVIPRAYIDDLYRHARSVAVGDQRSIGERRHTVVQRLIKMGATEERILAKVNRADVEEITAEDLETLIGIGTAIKEGASRVDEQFPPPVDQQDKPSLDAVTAANKAKSESAKPAPINQDADLKSRVVDAARGVWGDDAMLKLGQEMRKHGTSLSDASDEVLAAVLAEINKQADAAE